MKIRDRIGISDRTQVRISNFMQLALALTVAYGFYVGNTGIIANAGVGFIITFVPALLEKDHEIVLDPLLTLWITSAVFFHGVGTLGPYGNISWWDSFTHTLSASVVAAAGYSMYRSLDLHSKQIQFPKNFVFIFILMFVMAFGVVWELLEFAISEVANLLGTSSILTQHGLEDTLKDLMFDSAGGLAVALFGEAYLSGVVEQLGEKIRASQ